MRSRRLIAMISAIGSYDLDRACGSVAAHRGERGKARVESEAGGARARRARVERVAEVEEHAWGAISAINSYDLGD